MDEREIHLRDYFRVIGKRKWSILTFFVITVIVVVIVNFTATPLYYTSTKVLIEQNTSDALTSSYRYTPYDPQFIETHNQLIMSESVVENAVKSLGPEKIYDSFFIHQQDKHSYIESIKKWAHEQYLMIKESIGIDQFFSDQSNGVKKKIIPAEMSEPLSKAQILAKLIKNSITVTPVDKSRILQIGYISDNPVVAMKVANSIAQAYIDELVDMQMEVSSYSIGWMKKKADIQRVKLEDSEKALHAYKRKHGIVTVEDKITVLPERLADLSKNLTLAETKRKEVYAVYSKVKKLKKAELETIPMVVENPSIININKEVLTAEQKISELSKKYGPKHPRMVSARNELKSLERKKSIELDKVVQTIRNEYLLAQSNERDLRTALDQTKFQAARLGEKSIQLGILQRKVDTNRYLYDALVTKMKERGITERSQPVNVWIIEKAPLPTQPAKPNKKRNILLGIFFGLAGGMALAFFFEYLDNTVKTPEDVEERFDIPVLCTIDYLKEKNQTIIENVLEDSSSLIAENFKGLRTSVLLSAAGTPPKTIVVSSIAPGEGKSSVSGCLAYSLSQAGKSVLLIDADMRRPVQHKNFGFNNAVGLSSLLAGISDKTDAIESQVTENLDIISSGPIPPNPSELLSSDKFTLALQDFSKTYDIIIIDTPPIASVTDPIILSQHVDSFIIVTWAGKTTHEMLGKGIKQLKEVDGPLTGVVLNRFNAKKTGYYYNYGDYYYSSES